jgi:hypothetical protein
MPLSHLGITPETHASCHGHVAWTEQEWIEPERAEESDDDQDGDGQDDWDDEDDDGTTLTYVAVLRMR